MLSKLMILNLHRKGSIFMKMKNRDKKEPKRLTKSIRNQIIATGICPLVVMSTVVSVLSLGGYSPITAVVVSIIVVVIACIVNKEK